MAFCNPHKFKSLFLILAFFSLLTTQSRGVPVSPEAESGERVDDRLRIYNDLLSQIRITDVSLRESSLGPYRARSVDNDTHVDTIMALVLLVEFPGRRASGDGVYASAGQFDSLLFSEGGINPSGSMTEYFLENSYGKLLVKGEVRGWFMMPNEYEYYTADKSGLGQFYPHNSRGVAVDAIRAADSAGVDFSRYDRYGPEGRPDGRVDALILVHAGTGANETLDADELYPHKWQLDRYSQFRDGVEIDDFTVQAEESYFRKEITGIGIFCHEFGHILGLPDLYDVDGQPSSSAGLGVWSLMALGCYNGNTRRPAHLDAWSKAYLGFVEPVEIHKNLKKVEVPQVESEPVIYKLWKDGIYGSEYFLVENRQRIGFDDYLPGGGLLVYHVDDEASFNNVNVSHYHVALEQADGLFQLEYDRNNRGDAGDPFPGDRGITSFDDFSVPSSRGYDETPSRAAVWNISESDSLMAASFDVSWSQPFFTLDSIAFIDRNNDGILAPGEKISIYLFVTNHWAEADDFRVTVGCKANTLIFDDSVLYESTVPGDGYRYDNFHDPIEFVVPENIIPVYDTFYVMIEAGQGAYSTTFAIERQVGPAPVLIVNGDFGTKYDSLYLGDLHRKNIPADIWSIETDGPPESDLLDRYNKIFWFTGDSGAAHLGERELNAIRDYLDGGGNLFITGQKIAAELSRREPSFLREYLRAEDDGSCYANSHYGVPGSFIGEDLSIRYYGWHNQDYSSSEQIIPVNGGQAILEFRDGGYSAVSYEGGYKLVFLNFGYEAVDEIPYIFNSRHELLDAILLFFGTSAKSNSGWSGASLDVPDNFVLEQNYPNPFNPVTTIRYSIYQTADGSVPWTSLKIYNTLGQEVKTLVDRRELPGGYSIEWDGTDEGNNPVASGIYFYRLIRGDSKTTKKMLLLK